MNTKDLTIYKIPYNTEKWHLFRTTGIEEYEGGIGGSEIGSVLGLNKYRPVSAEVFHYKVGSLIQEREDNRSMLMGRILEPIIKDIWCVYDNDEFTWVDNYNGWLEMEAGRRTDLQIRKARKVNGYLVNENCNFLFTSLDYWAEKGSFNLITGEKMKDGFPVEVKTINGFFANQWLNEIPAYHICQVNQQMIISNSNYCEIAVLIDGRVFKVVPIERDPKLCEQILEIGYEFWQKVLKGREIFKQKQEAKKKAEVEEKQAMLDSLEPMPDDSLAYEEYMKEKYKVEVDTVDGGLKEYGWAKNHIIMNECEKMFSSKKQHYKNLLIKRVSEEKAGKIDFGEEGYFSYLLEGKRTSPTARINLKFKPDKNKIEQEIDKLDLENL